MLLPNPQTSLQFSICGIHLDWFRRLRGLLHRHESEEELAAAKAQKEAQMSKFLKDRLNEFVLTIAPSQQPHWLEERFRVQMENWMTICSGDLFVLNGLVRIVTAVPENYSAAALALEIKVFCDNSDSDPIARTFGGDNPEEIIWSCATYLGEELPGLIRQARKSRSPAA